MLIELSEAGVFAFAAGEEKREQFPNAILGREILVFIAFIWYFQMVLLQYSSTIPSNSHGHLQVVNSDLRMFNVFVDLQEENREPLQVNLA